MSLPCRTLFPRLFTLAISLCLVTCATSPAPQKGLVDLRRTIPTLVIDLRYATADNITGRPLYPENMPCLLRASTAQKLKKAQAQLRGQGYGLKIWDAWRPTEVHQRLYTRGARTGLFLDPARGWSRHCGGVSVDATLVDLQGNEIPMPTGFDEDLPHTAGHRPPSDPALRRHVTLLHEAMSAAGFKVLPGEWWHFDDLDFLYKPIPVIKAADISVTLPD